MSIFQGWSQIHVMAGQNKSKEKVPYVSDPNQNLETTCNSKLKFTLLKDLFIKRVQKNLSKMNICSYLASYLLS